MESNSGAKILQFRKPDSDVQTLVPKQEHEETSTWFKMVVELNKRKREKHEQDRKNRNRRTKHEYKLPNPPV